MKRALLAWIAAGALTLGAARAHAAADCSFMGVTSPAFGSYDVFNAGSTDTAGGITYSCTGGATVVISLSVGNGPTFNPRHLQSAGGSLLSYNLYLDPAHSTIWGDGNSGTSTSPPNSPADGAVVMVPIYGSIPAHQDVPVGAYGDTITVTLNF